MVPYLASDYLAYKDEENKDALKLAIIESNESIFPYIEKLIEIEKPQNKEEIEKKWIYILMYWTYLNIDQYDDPLLVVEDIYCEFNHPQLLSKFIRYMPSDEPDLGSKELNIQRIYKRWQIYLKENSFYKKL